MVECYKIEYYTMKIIYFNGIKENLIIDCHFVLRYLLIYSTHSLFSQFSREYFKIN